MIFQNVGIDLPLTLNYNPVMSNIKTKWKAFKKSDLTQWESEAKSSFSEEDFCNAEWLKENWNILKGWILLNAENNEWIGVMFLSSHEKDNDMGLAQNHFRECWVSSKYRRMGFCQKLYDKMFNYFGNNNEISICVDAENFISKKAIIKNGFKKIGYYECWELYKYSPEK